MPVPVDIGIVAALELTAAIESVTDDATDDSPAASQSSGTVVLSGRTGTWDFPTITVPF